MKKIIEIKSIPLLLHLVDPIAVCIIDDIKIGCEPFQGNQQEPNKAYNFLYNLYNNSKRKRKLPRNFADHFHNSKEMELDEVFTACFGGTDDIHGGYNCIDFTIQQKKFGKKPIIIKDIIYGKRLLFDSVKLNLQVKLSIFESFIIFSNICVNNLIYWGWDLYKCNLDDFLDDRRKISEILNKRKEVKSHYNLHLFSINYLYYLRDALQEGDISPVELLRLNGAPVLSLFTKLPVVEEFIEEMFENLMSLSSLSENTKTVFYTFIKHFDYMPHKTHSEFLKNNPQILSELKSNVYSKFLDTEQIGKILESQVFLYKLVMAFTSEQD